MAIQHHSPRIDNPPCSFSRSPNEKAGLSGTAPPLQLSRDGASPEDAVYQVRATQPPVVPVHAREITPAAFVIENVLPSVAFAVTV